MSGILATFSDLKIIRTRKVAQIICEVPLEQANHALDILGGVPMPDREQWVGIAPVNPIPGAAHSAPAGAPSRQIPEPTATPADPIARPDIGTDPAFTVFTGDQFGAGQMPPGPAKAEASAADRARPHKRWADMPPSQRAGIMCADPRFWPMVSAKSEAEAAAWLRNRCCGILSRAELDEDAIARRSFDEVETEYLAEIGRIPRP